MEFGSHRFKLPEEVETPPPAPHTRPRIAHEEESCSVAAPPGGIPASESPPGRASAPRRASRPPDWGPHRAQEQSLSSARRSGAHRAQPRGRHAIRPLRDIWPRFSSPEVKRRQRVPWRAKTNLTYSEHPSWLWMPLTELGPQGGHDGWKAYNQLRSGFKCVWIKHAFLVCLGD